MNKGLKVAIITVASLLLSAVIIMIVGMFLNKPEATPQFVYTSRATTTSSTRETGDSTTQSTTDITSARPLEEIPVESNKIVLLTSNDPDNYFELTFNGNTVNITGHYATERIERITADDVSYISPVYCEDGSFTAELTPEPTENHSNLRIITEDTGMLIWRIKQQNGEISFVICEEVMEQNEKAHLHILDIPTDIVADYIVTGGTEDQRTEVLAEISVIAEQVCEGIESDYDKARALSQWVSQNIYYDFDAYHSSVTTETLSLESTLSLHRSVCGGYANLYAALCQSQGIECYIAQGDVVQNHRTFDETDDEAPSHEWNLVCIDGRYFWVDTLWNNSGNIYIDGQYSEGSPSLRYFDPTEEVMSQDHRAKRIENRAFFN